MAALGSYKIPKPIQSEMKIGQMLYIKQVLYGLIGLAIGMSLCILLMKMGVGPILLAFGFSLAVLLTGTGIVLGIAKVPEHMHLYGPGTRIDTLILRILKKKRRKKRVIYTRCGMLESEKKNGK